MTHDDHLEHAVVAVRNDPAVRAVVEHLWRTKSCTPEEPTGTYVRGEEDALQWVAWDAFHAVEWGRDPSLCTWPGLQRPTSAQAVAAAFFDTGLHDETGPDGSLGGDVQVVLAAISAFG